jgi:hypothetical protein
MRLQARSDDFFGELNGKRPLQARRAKRIPHKSKETAPSFLQEGQKNPSPKKGKSNPQN